MLCCTIADCHSLSQSLIQSFPLTLKGKGKRKEKEKEKEKENAMLMLSRSLAMRASGAAGGREGGRCYNPRARWCAQHPLLCCMKC